MVPLNLRVVVTRLYENVITRLKTIKGWFEEIKWKIMVKQGFPLSPTHFGIYIDKLEECLESIGCNGPKLIGIVILLPFMLTILFFFLEVMMILTSSIESSMITAPRWV